MDNLNFFEHLSESLRPVIRQEVSTAVSMAMKQKPESKPDRINIHEVCQITGYSEPTIYSKVNKAKRNRSNIPFRKINGRLTFSRRDIEAWMESDHRV